MALRGLVQQPRRTSAFGNKADMQGCMWASTDWPHADLFLATRKEQSDLVYHHRALSSPADSRKYVVRACFRSLTGSVSPLAACLIISNASFAFSWGSTTSDRLHCCAVESAEWRAS